jgi:hypothetical protein
MVSADRRDGRGGQLLEHIGRENNAKPAGERAVQIDESRRLRVMVAGRDQLPQAVAGDAASSRADGRPWIEHDTTGFRPPQ